MFICGSGAGLAWSLLSLPILILFGGEIIDAVPRPLVTIGRLGSFTLSVVAGIWVVWLYAAIRPRYGAGLKTAAIAGFSWWLIATIATSQWVDLGFIRFRGLVGLMIASLPILIAATMLGAWSYQKKDRPKAFASTAHETDEEPLLQPGGAMTDQELERVLDEWAKAWSAHDIDRLVALFTEDCLYEDVALQAANRGKAELRTFAEQTFATIPDFSLQLTSRFASGNHGAIEWTMSGTQKVDIPGMPATGKSFSSLRAVTIVEFRGGKIHRNTDYWDLANVMRQTGVLPAA